MSFNDDITCEASQESPCAGVECGAHGACDGGSCACTDGYTGTNCDTPPVCDNVTVQLRIAEEDHGKWQIEAKNAHFFHLCKKTTGWAYTNGYRRSSSFNKYLRKIPKDKNDFRFSKIYVFWQNFTPKRSGPKISWSLPTKRMHQLQSRVPSWRYISNSLEWKFVRKT